MSSAAEVIAAGLSKLREDSAGNLHSLQTQLEERYRAKFEAYRKREEALVAQVKHAVDRAERFGRYEAEKKYKSKIKELEAALRDSVAEQHNLKRVHAEQIRFEKQQRIASEVRAQRARNEMNECILSAKRANVALRRRFREVAADLHRELSKSIRSRISEEVEADLYESLRPKIEQSLRHELLPEVKQRVKNDLRASIEVEIRAELSRESSSGHGRKQHGIELDTHANEINDFEIHSMKYGNRAPESWREDSETPEAGRDRANLVYINTRKRTRKNDQERSNVVQKSPLLEQQNDGESNTIQASQTSIYVENSLSTSSPPHANERRDTSKMPSHRNQMLPRSVQTKNKSGNKNETTPPILPKRGLLWADDDDSKECKTQRVIPSKMNTRTSKHTVRRAALNDLSNHTVALSAPVHNSSSIQTEAYVKAAPFSIALDAGKEDYNRAGKQLHASSSSNQTFNKIFSNFDPLYQQDHHDSITRFGDSGYSSSRHGEDGLNVSDTPTESNFMADDCSASINAGHNLSRDEIMSPESSQHSQTVDSDDLSSSRDLPCKSTKKHRRSMREMILGRPLEQRSNKRLCGEHADQDSNRIEFLKGEDRNSGLSSKHDASYDCDEMSNITVVSSYESTEHLHVEDHYQSSESDDADSIEDANVNLVKWRQELLEEMNFVREVKIPLVSDDESNPISHVAVSEFSSVAALAAELFELWNSLGVSYGARRRTLRALHITASEKSSCKKLMKMMLDMKSKLQDMLKVVRREMAAVRRCDELLRTPDLTELQRQQLPKLVSVLQRVLPKWELANGRPFLFRGIRYLDLMPILLDAKFS